MSWSVECIGTMPPVREFVSIFYREMFTVLTCASHRFSSDTRVRSPHGTLDEDSAGREPVRDCDPLLSRCN